MNGGERGERRRRRINWIVKIDNSKQDIVTYLLADNSMANSGDL